MKLALLSVVCVAISANAFAGQVITYTAGPTVMNRLHTLNSDAKIIQASVMCFQTGEQISGMNKICFYDCLGSAAAITISSVALCPLSINR